MIRQLLTLAVVGCAVATSCNVATASHWAFRQAPFTHDPVTGERVTQYAESAPTYAQVDPTYQQSGQILQTIRLRSGNGGIDQILFRERWGFPWYYGYPY